MTGPATGLLSAVFSSFSEATGEVLSHREQSRKKTWGSVLGPLKEQVHENILRCVKDCEDFFLSFPSFSDAGIEARDPPIPDKHSAAELRPQLPSELLRQGH